MTGGGGPQLVSFRELARRLVAEGVFRHVSHQYVSKLHRTDPDFPPVVEIGRSKAVDWNLALPYFKRRSRQEQQVDDAGQQPAPPDRQDGTQKEH